ncbi:MAG TPA: hypothetical protein P5279_15695 [Anaerohalosphaeraceae bacterium]|nr:hypothetical protein [Anaerohalosphaeraceae bacterium]HRT51932.1 hypothetical protein [Anaerohalosphaeraceae bacterium]HRT87945.1 hypothetical protein [Anaerohalosphaeraceae bacterium]
MGKMKRLKECKMISRGSMMVKQHPSVLAVATICVLAIVFAAFWEVGAAACASAVFFAGYGFFWTMILLPLLFWRASVLKFVCYASLIVSLAVLYLVPWNSRKPFLRDFGKVRVGTSVSEVQAIMGKYMKGTGWPAPPTDNSSTGTLTDVRSGITLTTCVNPAGEIEIRDSITYRHSNKAAFNSDWAVVRFENGKVVSKTFMPD